MSYKLPLCPRCGGEPVLYREKNSNGADVITARCHLCNGFVDSRHRYLPKDEHPNWKDYPLFRDLTKESPKCSVNGCNNHDVEWHHYAPRSLFANADDWAAGWLCMAHHLEWHEKTKTGMFAKRKS
jgi:hypothetical protein